MQTIHIDNHLRLEPLTEHHAEPLFHLIETHRTYLRTWLPWLDKNTCVEHLQAFTRQAHARNAGGEGLIQAIVVDDKVCGVSGFNFIDSNNRWGEIGYWLAQNCQGQGIVTRCVAVQVEHGFRNLNLHRISICAATQNTKSRAIPERLGFQLEGVLRQSEWLYDHYVDQALYARLSTDSL